MTRTTATGVNAAATAVHATLVASASGTRAGA
jgi:hypothetical protein